MSNAWAHDNSRPIHFPEIWPKHLQDKYKQLADGSTRVNLRTVSGELFKGCLLTSDDSGHPCIARYVYNGILTSIYPIYEMIDTMTSTTKRHGVYTKYWDLGEDDPVLWVILQ